MKKFVFGLTTAALLLTSAATTMAAGKIVGSNVHRDGLPELTFCGASKSGNYTKVVGGGIAAALEGIANVNIMTTNGTPDILNQMGDETCDMGAVQADGLITADIDPEPITLLYPEYVHFMCRDNADIDDAGDLLSKKPKIAIGKATGGSATTWRSLIKLDKRFAKVPTSTKSGSRAASSIMSKEVACILSVTGLNSASIKKLGARTQKSLSFVDFEVGDFDGISNAVNLSGDPLYQPVEINDEDYKPFSHVWGDPNVLAVDAILVGSPSWIENTDESDLEDIYGAILEIALPNIRAAVGYVPSN